MVTIVHILLCNNELYQAEVTTIYYVFTLLSIDSSLTLYQSASEHLCVCLMEKENSIVIS